MGDEEVRAELRRQAEIQQRFLAEEKKDFQQALLDCNIPDEKRYFASLVWSTLRTLFACIPSDTDPQEIADLTSKLVRSYAAVYARWQREGRLA